MARLKEQKSSQKSTTKRTAKRTKPSKYYPSKETISDSDDLESLGSGKRSTTSKDTNSPKSVSNPDSESGSESAPESEPESEADETQTHTAVRKEQRPERQTSDNTKRDDEGREGADSDDNGGESEEAEDRDSGGEIEGAEEEDGDSDTNSEQEPEQSSKKPNASSKDANAKRANGTSNSTLVADTIRPITPFIPPPGFNRVKSGPKVSVSSQFSESNLEGKEIWHITVPAGVSLNELHTASLVGMARGDRLFEKHGVQFGFVPQGDQTEDTTIMLPEKNGYNPSMLHIAVFK
jgi:hypothetical protein